MNEELSILLKQFELDQINRSIYNRNSRVLIVDGLNLFIGAFSASPAMNARGEHVGGIKGFLTALLSVIRRFEPTRCIVVFDGHDGSARRRKIYPDYKAGRKNRIRLNRLVAMNESESIRSQLIKLGFYLNIFPVSVVMIDHIEADDTIGYLTSTYYNGDTSDIIIVSSDKDFLQLIGPRVSVYRSMQKKLYDVDVVVESYGIPSYNFLTYRTISGDPSDNIPGVTGVGLKTLIKLVPSIVSESVSYTDVIRIAREKVDAGSKLKSYRNIAHAEDILHINHQLMQLSNVDISETAKFNINRIVDASVPKFDIMEFRRLLYADGMSDIFETSNSQILLTLSQLNHYAEADN